MADQVTSQVTTPNSRAVAPSISHPYSLSDAAIQKFVSAQFSKIGRIEQLDDLSRQAIKETPAGKGKSPGHGYRNDAYENKLLMLPAVRELFHIPADVKGKKVALPSKDGSTPTTDYGKRLLEATRYDFDVSYNKQVNSKGEERTVYQISFGARGDKNYCSATFVKDTKELIRCQTLAKTYQEVSDWNDK